MLLTVDNALPIAKAAALLKIPNAMSSCLRYMSAQLNASNCIQFLVDSRDTTQNFQKFVKLYAVQHFAEIVKSESMVLLSADEMSEFLRNDNLMVDSEEIVFRALTKWYRHDANDRQGATKEMLRLIRFGDLSPLVRIIKSKTCENLYLFKFSFFSVYKRYSHTITQRS